MPRPDVGLGPAAHLIQQLRSQVANSLLLDAGDLLQGNPMADYMALERGLKRGEKHPVIGAMNALRYDAMTLGNHDFNYGLPFLEMALEKSACPVVCANAIRKAGSNPRGDEGLLPPWVVLDRYVADSCGHRHLLRIGVIGLTPPQIVKWDSDHLRGNVTTRGIPETAAAHLPVMKEAGADIIIAICHSGLGHAGQDPLAENAAIQLAQVPGIDAMVLGHSHQVFPGPGFRDQNGLVDAVHGTICGVPTTMAGFWGSHVGVIDLALVRQSGVWRVSGHRAKVHSVACHLASEPQIMKVSGPQESVLDDARAVHHSVVAYSRRPVGHLRQRLHSYFAQIEPNAVVQLLADAQRWHVARGLANSPAGALPLLSAAAPFKCGGRTGAEFFNDIPEGPLSLRHTADICLYPNQIRAVCITGAQLKEWLERAAGQFMQIAPGIEDQCLLDPEFPCYNFDCIDGIDYVIDLSQAPLFTPFGTRIPVFHGDAVRGAGRIVSLRHDGQKVAADHQFVVATNNYRVSGGGAFAGIDEAQVVYRASWQSRKLLENYIRFLGEVGHLPLASRWRFAPLPGASVRFAIGQGARNLVPPTGVVRAAEGIAPGQQDVYRLTL